MLHRIGSAAAVLFLAASGLAVTASPSQAAAYEGGRYNRAVNCYSAIIASSDLMTRGAVCHNVGGYYAIYTREAGDRLQQWSGRYNRIGNCYKGIRSDAWLMTQNARCGLYWGVYEIDLVRGPFNG